MKWRELMPFLIVDDEDIMKFTNYIDNKGVYLHLQIYEILLSVYSECNYKLISSIIRYDKGIRNVLYKYLSAFEERYRAVLFEKYDVLNPLENPEIVKIEKLELIRSNSTSSNLYDISYSRYFGLNDLRKTLLTLKLISNDVNDDFLLISKLRNITMHHNLLMTSYHRDINNVNKEISKIENWVELLYKYLPKGMNREFEKAINRCNNIGTKMNVPNLEIVCLREMRNGVFI